MPRGTWWRYDYNARAADYNHVGYNEPDTVLIAQLMGVAPRQARRGQRGHAFGNVRDPASPDDRASGEPAADVGDAASHRKPARSQRSAIDVRLRIVHRRTGGGGEGRSAGIPHEAAHRQHRRTTAGFKRARSIAVLKAVAEAYGWDKRPSPKPRGHGRHPDRARYRLRLPRPDRRRGDRRGRGESPHRPCLGEAAGVRARLRTDGQPRVRCVTPSNAPCSTR